MTPTIFVQIAAYRDPDLSATLHNLIQRAAHPERLHLGICLQLADDDPPHWGPSAFPNHPHLEILRFHAAESRGACWARRQAQSVYGGEDFLLQIDSHMRAVEHWDDLLLKTWKECSDKCAVLSVYPNSFQQPCQLQTSTLPVMGAAGFDANGILKFQGISRFRLPDEQPERPIPGAFIAGGFMFGPGSIVNEVPYDPELYFYGEEVSMSARLWTSGFNIYAPNRLLLFISTSQKAQQQSIQPTTGTITVNGISTTFARSNVFTHCWVVSTTPLLQSVAAMIIQASSIPMGWAQNAA